MCIFCEIVKGNIPSSCIYEDEKVMAFLDLAQVTKGHTLVIPKQHFNNMLECDDETLAHLMKVSKMLGNRIVERLHAGGMNVLSNVNEVAGQSVSHFHVHLIPRYHKDDACVIRFEESQKQDINEIFEQLK